MCDESGEMRDQNDIAFGILSEKNKWMRCPVCRHCVEKRIGCARVQCRCGIIFCYNCGKKMSANHLCNPRQTFNRRPLTSLDWCVIFSFILLLVLMTIYLVMALQHVMRQNEQNRIK